MKKNSIFIKTYFLLWIFIILIMSIVAELVVKIIGTGVSATVIIGALIVSFPLTFIIFKIIMARAHKSPLAITYSEFQKEVQENGLSERLIELVDKGLSEIKNPDTEIGYIVSLATAGCEYYIYKRDNEKALQYINIVDIKKVKEGKMAFLDGGAGVVTYFTGQMELCQAMKDPARANNVIADGKPFLDKHYGKMDALDVLIDDVWFLYHYTLGDYAHAREHAQKILNNKVHNDTGMVTGYAALAMVCSRTGDTAKAEELMSQAERIAEESGKVIAKQSPEGYYREFPKTT
ncbi:MAG: hypothetical protein K5871_03615 [Lachnospiraceae bacterium]|nr:hypothetical protein [Lachnospiraceae bacterium]